MSPKSGSAGSAVSPAAPKVPKEADTADPGEVAQVKARERENKSGKYGSEKVKPFKPPQTPEEEKKKTSWIEIELLDALGNPVAGETYRVKLSDGSVAEGTLNEKGLARLEPVEPGNCEVTFPNMDGRSWEKA
jgi:type VI secretion system secreted protein VgrG